MKALKCAVVFLFLLAGKSPTWAQDPTFSQFFSSPLNINPALTANGYADWRVISNLRNQWITPTSPHATGTLSFDTRIKPESTSAETESNTWGLGGMIMRDRAMAGVLKSTYASINASYGINLAEADLTHHLRAGFGALYGNRMTDISGLDFQEQFTGSGFNSNLPTSETALSNMKSYFSVAAGLTYSIRNEKSNMDMGIAAFHLNKPRQTFLKDENQIVPIRKVAHINFEKLLDERFVISTNAIYQNQLKFNYFSIGGTLGYILGDEEETIINAGLWYWSKNAIVPYLGLNYKAMQFGLTYDLTIAKWNEAPRNSNSWELSFIFRGTSSPLKGVPSPWK